MRLSGPDVVAIIGRVFLPQTSDDKPAASLVDPRRPSVFRGQATIELTCDGSEATARKQLLPCELYLWPTARSYTREPVAELHTLGSPPLLQALLRATCKAGARLARPGEFTLRAFLAGRLDLVQAEAVLGVIDAASRQELDVALAQLAGGLTRPLTALRSDLLDLLADLEAGLDFVEDDIRFVASDELQVRLAAAAAQVSEMQMQMEVRARSDGEARVVLVGSPNVGKSSLFNALAGRAAALVSSQPGTTRDYLSARVELGSIACQLIDTAGSEPEAMEPIAQAAEQFRTSQSAQARLRLLCLDSTRSATAWEERELNALDAGSPALVVFTKCDAGLAPVAGAARSDDGAALAASALHTAAIRTSAVHTSAATGAGLDALREAIRGRLAELESPGGQAVPATAARCRESLRLAGESLARAAKLAALGGGEELIAAELRLGLEELGQVVGAVYTEDLLDRIFSRFCIGK